MDKNHINICKPESKKETIYLGILRRLQTICAQQTGANDLTEKVVVDDYSEKSELDRRNLREKLIAAERDHEYDLANNAQNRFAREYLRTGLLKIARRDHDKLLAEIETRFITHIYHPLICHHADDEQVRDALQAHVIDPITKMQFGTTEFSAKAIFNGIYFLTEQCHIRWDSPG